MRDPRRKLAKDSRRRVLVALIMMTTAPALADGPHQNNARILPPLPLTSADNVKSNPFCEPATRVAPSPVTLASGSNASTIRLKPIGAAIGLQSIGSSAGQPSGPKAVRPPAMTIEPIETKVQNNPLIRSEHHNDRPLIDTQVVDQTATRPTDIAVGTETNHNANVADERSSKSTIVLIPPAPVDARPETPQAAPHLLSVPAQPNDAQPKVPAQAAMQPVPVQQVPVQTAPVQPMPTQQTTVQPNPVQQAPVQSVPVQKVPAIQPTIPAPQAVPVATRVPQVAPIASIPQAAVAEPEAKPEDEHTEPVYFSMSDRFDSPAVSKPSDSAEESSLVAAPAPTSTERVAEAEPLVPAEATAAEATNPDADDASAKGSLAKQVDQADDEPLIRPLDAPVRFANEEALDGATLDGANSDLATSELGIVEPITLDDFDHEFLSPIVSVHEEEESPAAVYGNAPVVAGPVESPEATLHTKRYRPPVAVKPVPIVFERQGEASPALAGSTVQSVESFNLDGFVIDGRNVKLTPLHMSRTQVRSLTLGGSVRNVKVADKSICQAFAAGTNQLKLIGTGTGVTRLVVWADTDDADNPTRMRAFEVHVNDTVESTGDSVANKAKMLNQTIRKAFPNCNVTVQPTDNRLIVSGRCDSESSAKKIMQIVRKTCLVPVQDQLMVR